MSAGKLPVKWRMLKGGEILEKGDKYQHDRPNGPWIPVRDGAIGLALMASNVGFFRRRVSANIKPKPRRESLTGQFATAIQAGRNNPAMDTAKECMRILDNQQRAKRRKGKK